MSPYFTKLGIATGEPCKDDGKVTKNFLTQEIEVWLQGDWIAKSLKTLASVFRQFDSSGFRFKKHLHDHTVFDFESPLSKRTTDDNDGFSTTIRRIQDWVSKRLMLIREIINYARYPFRLRID